MISFILLSLIGFITARPRVGQTLTVSHPRAELRAVAFTQSLVDASPKHDLTHARLYSATKNLRGFAVVHNLNAFSQFPRLIQYQFYSFGAWVKVCVVAPAPNRANSKLTPAVYSVVCPA